MSKSHSETWIYASSLVQHLWSAFETTRTSRKLDSSHCEQHAPSKDKTPKRVNLNNCLFTQQSWRRRQMKRTANEKETVHVRPQHSIVILKSIMHPFILAWLWCKKAEKSFGKHLGDKLNIYSSLNPRTTVFDCNLEETLLFSQFIL